MTRPRTARPVLQLAGLVGSYLVVPAASFAAAPILARALGPEGRGELAALQNVLVLATVVVAAGLPEAFALARGRHGAGFAWLLRHHWPLVSGGCAAGAVAVYLLAPTLSGGSAIVSELLRWTCWIVVPLVLIEIARGSCKGAGRFSALRNEQIVFGAGRLAVLVLLLAAGALTVGTAYLATVGTAVAGGIFLLCAARASRADEPAAEIAAVDRRRFRSLAARFSLSTIAIQANVRLDQAILLPVVGAHSLGLYAVAVAFAQVLNTVFFGIRNFLYGRMVRADSSLVFRILRVLLAAQVLLVAVLAIGAGPATRFLFGPEYEESVSAMRILLAGVLPINVSGLLAVYLAARGRAGRAAIAEVVALVVTILGLLVVAPVFGIVGAAWVSCVAYTTSAAVMVCFARNAAGSSLREMFVLRRSDLSILRKAAGGR